MRKIAVVTGASSGIGKAIYNGIQDMGFDLVSGLSRNGPNIYADVRDLDIVFPVQGECHLLVNAAGIMPFDETPAVMDVNFWGTYNMIRALEHKFAHGACIINIASVSGMMHDSELPIYSASKAAVISLTKSFAKYYAPYIRVNCISPGFFYPTNLVSEPPPAELVEGIPLRYAEDPDELVPIVKMIYQSKYMTGANIVVDGGCSC